MKNTFTKAERLCSQTSIDWLFDGKGEAFSAFPLRVVYKSVPLTEGEAVLPKLLVSVPKKRFHHAVDRNHAKRLVREAYRKHKQAFVECAARQHLAVTLAFIYIGGEMATADEIERRVATALGRMVKALDHEKAD